MASVFLSYDRDDAERARPIVAALEKAGHSVWWDLHVRGGAQFSKVIEEALKAADVVVVLWSANSVESAWVRDEAAAGRDSGRLVPITIDGTQPPLGFRQFHTLDLSGRDGPHQLESLFDAVESTGTREAAVSTKTAPKRVRTNFRLGRNRNPWPMFGLLALVLGLLILVLGLIVSRPWEAKASVAVVAIRPADLDPDSRALARDLLVRLGGAQSRQAQAVQLVDENARAAPNLILEVSGRISGGDPSGNLVLLRAKDRQILYSLDLAVPEGEAADLKMSVAVAAMSALECATAAVASRPALGLDLLKQYLGACTRFASLYGMEDASILIPQLEQLVKREPDFLPARKQLLLTGAFMRSIPTESAKPSLQWLQAQVDAARRIDPAMAEVRLAELELLPLTDFAGRMRIVDSLREAFPDDMFVLGARAEQLMLVGRNNEAVVDAERTARLDPLAPYSRSEYIRTLAFSGRLSRAFEELHGFEPLSPVAMNMTDTKFRVNMRYGDARPALWVLRTYGTSKAHDAFLAARIDPTEGNIERAMAIARAVAVERGFYATPTEVLEVFGRDDEVYQLLMRMPPARADQFLLQTLFRPTLSKLRQNPRFLRVAHRFGLLDYWSKSGKWPDFCFEPELPYDCKKEAARLTA